MPVMLPPGRASDATKPVPTGSAGPTIMIGIVAVLLRAAAIAGVTDERMTSTLRLTSSAAKSGKCVEPDPGERASSTTLRPSSQPKSRRPSTRACKFRLLAGSPGDAFSRTPTRRGLPGGWLHARKADSTVNKTTASGLSKCPLFIRAPHHDTRTDYQMITRGALAIAAPRSAHANEGSSGSDSAVAAGSQRPSNASGDPPIPDAAPAAAQMVGVCHSTKSLTR